MCCTWRKKKERSNIRKYGLESSLAEQIFADPLAETVLDRVVNGEERWRTIGDEPARRFGMHFRDSAM
jgi:uncharacterized DUF497 family protein